MEENGRAIYEFGGFRFHSAQRVLFRGTEVVPLTPKVADTLLALLNHHDHVVEKSELIRTIWPDTFVEEGGLARNISVLRKALGDEPDGCQYIETIPKRGYRFVAPVREVASEPECNAGTTSLTAGAGRATGSRALAWRGIKVGIAAIVLLAAALVYIGHSRKSHETAADLRLASIAVLPLKNLSADAAQDYFSEGITDTLATDLAKRGVRVIASSSVRRLRQGASINEIGQQLKVDAVVQGTVLGSDNRVRINAQLVDVRTGRLVWADSYQRSLRDVLTLQAEVTGAITGEVLASVASVQKAPLRRARAVIPEAYLAYLKGRFFWNKRTEEGLRKAIEYFDEAIAKDPTYAPAHAGVADSYALLGSNGYDAMPPREAMPRAKTAALEALALDNGLAEAHTSLAYVLMAYDWDLPAARKEFQEAFRYNPGYATAHHWYSHYLLADGQPDQALAEMKQALALDPLSLPVNVGVGWCSYFARRYDEAIGQYQKTLELQPDFALAHQALGMALAQKGAYAEAIVEFKRAVALSGGGASAIASLGYASARAGATADARAQLEKLSELSRRNYVPAIYMSLIYLGLGDKNGAAQWFSKAREERSEYLIYHRLDPDFDSIRADKRFALALPASKRDR